MTYNVIIEIKKTNDNFDIYDISKDVDIFLIPEMKTDTYLLLFKDKNYIHEFIELLKLETNIKVIGVFNSEGEKVEVLDLSGKPISDYKHSIQKYQKQLDKKRTYNEEGDLIEERDYTIEEAKEKQILKIFGNKDRIINL